MAKKAKTVEYPKAKPYTTWGAVHKVSGTVEWIADFDWSKQKAESHLEPHERLARVEIREEEVKP